MLLKNGGVAGFMYDFFERGAERPFQKKIIHKTSNATIF